MNTVEVINKDFDKKLWNEKATHPVQSWQWGEAREEMGLKIVRICESSYAKASEDKSVNSELLNVYQMTLHKLPFVNKFIGYIPMCDIPSKEVLGKLEEIGRENNCVLIKFEPNVFKDEVKEDAIPHLLGDLIVKSKYPIFYNWTLTVDLTKPEDQLLSEMKQKTRYNIKLANKKGVVVKEVRDEKGFNEFLELFFETTRRQGYYGHTKKFHEIVWKNMKEEISHLFIAYFEGKPLAAFELFYFNNVLYYPYGGTSNENRNVMAPNLLMWEAMKFGMNHKAKYFDMWGANDPASKEAESGYARFKEGYGGTYREMIGSFDLVINRLQYKIYLLSYGLRKVFLRLKKVRSTINN
jgi:peptidoglycan pentaglycine glycine transferase (the first glycine)